MAPQHTIEGALFDRLDGLVEQLLRQAGITMPPVPVRIVEHFDSHPIEIITYPLHHQRGILQRRDDGWRLLVRAADSYRAQRQTIFHKGGHMLYRTGQLVLPSDHPADVEWVCDELAIRLLLPARWVRRLYREQSAAQLARTFQAPLPVVRERLRSLGLAVPDPSHLAA